MVTYRNVGEIIGYVEYIGDASGSYTPDIATVGEIIGYVEYIYEPDDGVATVGEIIGYVEYIGDAAGEYTADIPTVGEIIGYVEYVYTGAEPEPPTLLVYGPLVWMM